MASRSTFLRELSTSIVGSTVSASISSSSIIDQEGYTVGNCYYTHNTVDTEGFTVITPEGGRQQ